MLTLGILAAGANQVEEPHLLSQTSCAIELSTT